MEATIGRGPVGTGVFLLQQGAGGAASRQADVWWCFAFLPLVPLSRWQIEALAEPTEQSVGFAIRQQSRIPLSDAIREIARAATGGGLISAVLAFAIWTIGVPWASQPLRNLQHGMLGATVHGRLGMIIDVAVGMAGMTIETGVYLMGAAIPVVVLMYLDQRTYRVSVRSVLRFWREATPRLDQAA